MRNRLIKYKQIENLLGLPVHVKSEVGDIPISVGDFNRPSIILSYLGLMMF